MFSSNDNGLYMPVAPAYAGYGGNYGNGGFFGGDGIWAVIILALLFGGGGFGFGGLGGWGGMMGMGMADGMMLYPWMNQAEITTDGFRDQMLNSSVQGIQNAVTTGFGDVQTSLCSGFAGVNASINNAQNSLAQQMYTNQISDLERSFAAQTASTQGMNAIQSQLAQCCCDNRLATESLRATVLSENCEDRNQALLNTRDIITAITSGVQSLKDEIFADRLDDERRENQNLRQELLFARGQASQVTQNSDIINGVYNRLNECPVGTTPVYGRTPIFSCNGNGCGCSGNTFFN